MNVSRLLLAVTFVFSGLVKCGLTRVVPNINSTTIFRHSVGRNGFPGFLPLWLAVLLAVFEFCIGIYLFFGIRRRTTSWLFLLFMSVMTPLTLYLALANPVSDCGCFGDAVSLTNWETFGKNVVLLGLSVLVFRYRRLMVRFVSERNQWMISLYSIFFCLCSGGFLYLLSSGFRFPSLSYRSKPAPSDGGSGRRGGAGVSYDIRT